MQIGVHVNGGNRDHVNYVSVQQNSGIQKCHDFKRIKVTSTQFQHKTRKQGPILLTR